MRKRGNGRMLLALVTLLAMLLQTTFPVGVFATGDDDSYVVIDGERIYQGNMPVHDGTGAAASSWQSQLTENDGDDEYTNAIPLEFNFNFYGTDYSDIYLSTNGLLSFSSLAETVDHDNGGYPGYGFYHYYALTQSLIMNNIIAVFNDDLTVQNMGYDEYGDPIYVPSVYYKTIGEAPNRIFVAQWTNMYFWEGDLQFGDLQIILEEGTNKISLQYRTLNDVESGRSYGSGCQAGIENADGSAHVVYINHGLDADGNPLALSPGTCVTFTPDGAGSYVMDDAAPYDRLFLASPDAPDMPLIDESGSYAADGQSVSDSPTIAWTDSTGADSYRLLVSDDDTFANRIVDETTANADTTEWMVDFSALDVGTTYYWKVEAKNAFGSRVSPIYSFVAASPPAFDPSFENNDNPYNALGGEIVSGTAEIDNSYDGGPVWTIEPGDSRMLMLSPYNASEYANVGDTAGELALPEEAVAYLESSFFRGYNEYGDPFENFGNFSYMYADVNMEAGQTLSMAWNYIAGDYVPWNDGSFASFVNLDDPTDMPTINGTATNVGLLASNVSGTAKYFTDSYGSTGWQTATFEASEAGTYRIGFATFNLGDEEYNPTLFLDDPAGLTYMDGESFDPVDPDENAPPEFGETDHLYVDRTSFYEPDTTGVYLAGIEPGMYFVQFVDGVVVNASEAADAEFMLSWEEYGSQDGDVVVKYVLYDSEPAEPVVTDMGIDRAVVWLKAFEAEPPSSEASLYDLLVNEGEVNLDFNYDVHDYTLEVGNDMSSVTVDPRTYDGNASIQTVSVNGTPVDSWNPSTLLDLNIGENLIEIVVVAEDGYTTMTYTITIDREASESGSNDATLSRLEINEGELYLDFTSDVLDYTKVVGNPASQIEVNAVPTDENASILSVSVNGTPVDSWDRSTLLDMNVGENLIEIVVLAQDGTTTLNYTITIIREAALPTDADLIRIAGQTPDDVVELGGEDPEHAIGWHVTVPNDVDELEADDIEVSETASFQLFTDPAFTVDVTTGPAISLSEENTTEVYVKVTSGDESVVRYYAVTLERMEALGSEASLLEVLDDADVTVETGTGSAEDPFVVNLPVPYSTYELGFEDIEASAGARMRIFRDRQMTNEVAQGDLLGLTEGGTTVVYIRITSEDGRTVMHYALSITRARGEEERTHTGSGGSGTASSPSGSGTTVYVNGRVYVAGTSSEGTDDENRPVVTVTVDTTKLESILAQESENPVVSIRIPESGGVAEGVLTGQMVRDMENREAVLEIRTESATYTLPASEIDIDAISESLGTAVELRDIVVSVKISEPDPAQVRVVENSAGNGGFTIVVPAVEFTISCSSGGKTVEVSRFKSYVERLVAIPDGVDPSKITTGVVVDPDGTSRHVPTKVVVIDGKYYAQINSLTNSLYTVVWHPVAFADAAGHWAQAAIDNMGSRMVVQGVDGENYHPDAHVTRGEFATIVVKALGLAPGDGATSFTDVPADAWYAGYVQTAVSYGILTGYDAATFGPEDTITREQAMAMIARAMETTGLDAALTADRIDGILKEFEDAGLTAAYARSGIAACLSTGVVVGRPEDMLDPEGLLSRAEAAVIVERLLMKSGLI